VFQDGSERDSKIRRRQASSSDAEAAAITITYRLASRPEIERVLVDAPGTEAPDALTNFHASPQTDTKRVATSEIDGDGNIEPTARERRRF
jgi:hypothetical protein